MVGRAEWALGHESVAVENAGDRMNLGGFESFFKREGSEDRGQAFGQHRLTGARRADHKDVVAAGRCNLQCTFRRLLAADIAEVECELFELAKQLACSHAKWFTLDNAEYRRIQQFQNIKAGK